MLCSQSSIVNQGIDEARAVTLKCRAWTCELCQPDRQRQLVALARSGAPTTFITLTSNPRVGTTPASRARMLVDSWRKVVARAKRHYGYEKIVYLAVFEATKRGEPHLHILARSGWIDQRWLSAQMDALMQSPIVDIRRVRSVGMAAAYVSKYVGKEPHRFETCKRYWYSRGWDLSDYEAPPPDPRWSTSWECRDRPLATVEADWRIMGWHTHRDDGMLYGSARPPP